jgi:hypothetical protein
MSYDSLKGFSGTLSKGFARKFFQFFCEKSRNERREKKTKLSSPYLDSVVIVQVVKNLQDSKKTFSFVSVL